MTRKIFSRHFILLLVLLYWSNFVYSVRWTNDICSGDNAMVTFSKCCGNEPYCSVHTNQTDCNTDEVGLYCQWAVDDVNVNGKCVPKPDERSDVCCRGGAVKDACHSIAYKLECPKDWLVAKGCCPDAAERKYNKILGGIPDDMDCCNSPCTQVEKAISSGASNCTLSSRCAPGPRSYAMTYDPYNTLGFFHSYRPHGAPHAFGSVHHGTGYEDDYGPDYYEEDDHDYDKDEDDHDHDHDKDEHGYNDHVDEITVDDLFELLVEALEEDTDVKSYDAEYYTDPYLGKSKSGGRLADLNLPDPDDYLDLLYWNPWYNFDYEFQDPHMIYSSPYLHDVLYNQIGPYGYQHGPSYAPYGGLGPYNNDYGHNIY